MSWQRRALNFWLKRTEKRYLARATKPEELRRGFEAKARFWFRPPKGACFDTAALGGVPALWTGPETGAGVLLYFHGGGYVFGSPATHRAMLARLAELCGWRACLPDYRLAPEHPFPAAVEDARAAYAGLLRSGVAADRVTLGGDSAGGGLALALLADLLARGEPPPGALFALSPLTDLTYSGASFQDNARADAMLPVSRAGEMAGMYLQGHDPRDPLASPLYADFAGAPPVWLAAGDTEILRDDTTRIAAVLRAQGVAVTERIHHDLPHVWPLFRNLLPEGEATLFELAGWITQRQRRSDGS